MAFGDSEKLPTSNRVTLGSRLNDIQLGKPFFGGVSSGSSNNYVMNFASGAGPDIWSPVGQRYYFIADKTNAGAVTIKIGGVTKSLKDLSGANNLIAGAIRENDFVEFFYDGTNCRLIGATAARADENLISTTGGVSMASATPATLHGNLDLSVKHSEKVFINGFYSLSLGTVGADATLRLFRGASQIGQSVAIRGIDSSTAGRVLYVPIMHIDDPGPGNFSYSVTWEVSSGTVYGDRRKLAGFTFQATP